MRKRGFDLERFAPRLTGSFSVLCLASNHSIHMKTFPHSVLCASKKGWLIALIVFLVPSMIFAADFQGASSVLQKIEEQGAIPSQARTVRSEVRATQPGVARFRLGVEWFRERTE
jgi:hypothetical protein